MKTYLKRFVIKAFVWAVVLVLGARAYASVTVAVNLGANWVGTPTIETTNNPSVNLDSAESSWGSSAPYSLGQTFTAPVSGVLSNIQMYVTGKNITNIVCLYDMGPAIQYLPTAEPSPIVPGSNGVSGNLLSTNLSAFVTNMSNPSVIQFTFSGADAVQITGGHEYYYALVASANGEYWYRDGGSTDLYQGGAAYRQNSLINGSETTDFSLAVTLVNTSAPPTIYDCVVNWNNVHQRIDGFGACSAWQSTWTTNEANMFFSTNSGTDVSVDGKTNFPFNGIGLSLLRSRIAPGGTTVENNIMQMAQARGATVWSTPWSPAAQFKSNDNVDGGDFLSASNQAYANQLAGYVVNMKNEYGVNIYAISVQNEPDVSQSYESCIWTAAQIDQFVPYLASALVANNVASTKIIVPEDEYWETNYYATTMMDPTASTNVGIVACHDYSGSPPNDTPGVLPLYDNTNAAEWETETSELSGNGAFNGSITDAMYWAGRLQLFLSGANVNAWHYWWLMSGNPDNEGLTDTNGIPAQRMYVLGQYSRFVRPNSYRIDLANYNSYAILGTAYKNPVSGSFAIVMINTNSAATTQSFYFTNFTATTVTPWITSSNLSLAAQSPVTVSNSAFSYTIPGMSVITFVGAMTVASQTPVISVLPTASAISYGQTLASSTLSGGTVTNSAGATVSGNFAFTTPSTMPGGAGTPSESVTFTPTDTTDYTTATTNVSVTVNPQTPVISILPTASAITNGQTLASSTLSGGAATNAAGATLGGGFAFVSPLTEPRAGTPSELVTFTPTDNTDYNTATTPIYVTVYPQTPVISILPTASAINYGQTLANSSLSGGTVTNAGGAPVSGSFAFNTPSTAPGAGTPSELVTFTPIDNTDNTTATTNVQVTVNQATPVISSAPTASAINYGQTLASSTLSGGTASTAGAFAFTTPSTAPAAGTTGEPVTFSPTDSTDYSTATTSVSVTVNTVLLSITANDTNKVYGQTLTFAGTEFTTSGLLNSDSVTSVTLTSAGTTNTAPVNGSPYSITASAATGSGLGNYNITYYPGNLTVGPTVLGVTADNQSQLYGATNPVLTATFSGFVNGESLTNSDVVGVPQLSTLANTNSPVGTYVISISLGSLASTNYTFSLTNGTLTVVAPELTIVNAGATGFELTFPTSPGQMYQIECTTNLNDPVWTPLGDPIPGTGGCVSITNNSGACQCFYLLQISQQ